jgi:hypothetical protein
MAAGVWDLTLIVVRSFIRYCSCFEEFKLTGGPLLIHSYAMVDYIHLTAHAVNRDAIGLLALGILQSSAKGSKTLESCIEDE